LKGGNNKSVRFKDFPTPESLIYKSPKNENSKKRLRIALRLIFGKGQLPENSLRDKFTFRPLRYPVLTLRALGGIRALALIS
jgi:hypothetical protein